jgi:hypothetical protein
MRWCGDADATIVRLGDGAEPYRSSGEVTGELFELFLFIVKDELTGICRKALYSMDSTATTCS